MSGIKTKFDACRAKCRTSSQSVQHENKLLSPRVPHARYRDPAAKYCFGPRPAALVPTDLK
eukprot:m.89634 g.89634  ORF g.89634 m.89634 type:complete len:61 (-) comp8421_c0_seq2:370-552(-)